MTDVPAIDIRDARPEEFAAVGDLTVAAYAADGFVDDDDKYADELRDAARRAELAELLVAVDPTSRRVVGTATFCLPGSDYAELSGPGEAEFRMLAVAPDARGQGVGEALVQACLEMARAQLCRAVVISTLDAMTAAHALYARLGFHRVPERDWWPVPHLALRCFVRELNAALDTALDTQQAG